MNSTNFISIGWKNKNVLYFGTKNQERIRNEKFRRWWYNIVSQIGRGGSKESRTINQSVRKSGEIINRDRNKSPESRVRHNIVLRGVSGISAEYVWRMASRRVRFNQMGACPDKLVTRTNRAYRGFHLSI